MLSWGATRMPWPGMIGGASCSSSYSSCSSSSYSSSCSSSTNSTLSTLSTKSSSSITSSSSHLLHPRALQCCLVTRGEGPGKGPRGRAGSSDTSQQVEEDRGVRARLYLEKAASFLAQLDPRSCEQALRTALSVMPTSSIRQVLLDYYTMENNRAVCEQLQGSKVLADVDYSTQGAQGTQGTQGACLSYLLSPLTLPTMGSHT